MLICCRGNPASQFESLVSVLAVTLMEEADNVVLHPPKDLWLSDPSNGHLDPEPEGACRFRIQMTIRGTRKTMAVMDLLSSHLPSSTS